MGGAQHAGGLGVHDHLCWPYEDRSDFARRATEFLSDGLALGLKCVYAADRAPGGLDADLAGVPDLHAQVARGALEIAELSVLYPDFAVIDPDEMLGTIAAATEDALAQGYSGLRVVADVTPLLLSADQLAGFLSWEHTADRFIARNPVSGLCGVDLRAVPASTSTTLACMHPAARTGSAPFRVFAPQGPADLALAGEVDQSVADQFRACLEWTRVDVARELVVDGIHLRFVDHRGLEGIRDYAGASGATAVLRTSSKLPGRLIHLLGLEGIRAECANAEGVPAA